MGPMCVYVSIPQQIRFHMFSDAVEKPGDSIIVVFN